MAWFVLTKLKIHDESSIYRYVDTTHMYFVLPYCFRLVLTFNVHELYFDAMICIILIRKIIPR